jgi:5'-nucleotidase (lipoprotein e(P4) family)
MAGLNRWNSGADGKVRMEENWRRPGMSIVLTARRLFNSFSPEETGADAAPENYSEVREMIHPSPIGLVLLVSLFTVTGCTTSRSNSGDGPLVRASSGTAQTENYNRDLVMGILWQQQSGEYAALCYQAFNAGKSYILSLRGEEKRAAVLDIDETILDNSPYAAWMVKTGSLWANETWEEWCKAGVAPVVPGALDFVRFLGEAGVEVFYISNRPVSALDSTITNLKELQFPLADEDHVFLMENTSDKNPRIEKILSQGYKPVLFAGDNLDDFDSSIRRWNNQERLEWANGNTETFGIHRIVLPNSVYGTFESALVPNYYGLSAEERAAARLNLLDSWENQSR